MVSLARGLSPTSLRMRVYVTVSKDDAKPHVYDEPYIEELFDAMYNPHVAQHFQVIAMKTTLRILPSEILHRIVEFNITPHCQVSARRK